MAALATQSVAAPGGNGPTYAAAAGGGDTATPGMTTYLEVKNGAGAPITVTIPRYPALDPEGVAETPLVVTVPATTGYKLIGPLYPGRYQNPSTGNVDIAYSAVTTVTVAVTARN